MGVDGAASNLEAFVPGPARRWHCFRWWRPLRQKEGERLADEFDNDLVLFWGLGRFALFPWPWGQPRRINTTRPKERSSAGLARSRERGDCYFLKFDVEHVL